MADLRKLFFISDDKAISGKENASAAVGLSEFSVWSRHCLAGGMSAAISKTALAPLDRIKVQMQVTDCSSGGLRTTALHVYNSCGVRGFWRGNGLNVAKSSPEFAIKFSVYDYVKRELKMFRGDGGHLSVHERFVAGAMAGVFSQSFLYPIETVKTRLQMADTKYTCVANVVAKIYQAGGSSAFFKGFWPSMLSIFLFTGIDLTTYEHVKHWQTGSHTASQWSVNMISALCSSAVGVTICYPISTIITRLQVNCTGEISGFSNMKPFLSNAYCRGLYRGFSSSFMKMLPTMSITYVVYEELCKVLRVQMS